jgi:hypothetical protein
MELQLKTERQHKIADFLWQAQDQEMVNLILKTFGHDAHIVYNMMIAHLLDDVESTDIAEHVLNKIFKE